MTNNAYCQYHYIIICVFTLIKDSVSSPYTLYKLFCDNTQLTGAPFHIHVFGGGMWVCNIGYTRVYLLSSPHRRGNSHRSGTVSVLKTALGSCENNV